MKVVAMIPARLQSSRLPRKPLADICGMPMIEHVYRRCLLSKALAETYVCTDSDEVRAAAEKAGAKVVMTSDKHETGSDRIAEAARKIDCDVVVNVQGDEALMRPEHVDAAVAGLLADPECDIALLVNPFKKRGSVSDVKAVLDEKDRIMYMSRADIPSDARTPEPELLKCYHIVPFKKSFLLEFASWPKGRLETIEFIEYNRVLEKGRKMKAIRVESSAVSVDTPEDLAWVRSQMPSDPVFPLYKKR